MRCSSAKASCAATSPRKSCASSSKPADPSRRFATGGRGTKPDRERMMRILFVCMGNICRSPLAEGLFTHLAKERGLLDRFEIDSAGTGDWHVGHFADPRSQ